MSKKYEYKVVWEYPVESETLEYNLNLYGEYGWELCQLDGHRIILQREKAEE